MNFSGAFDGVIYFIIAVCIFIFSIGYGCARITEDYDVKIIKTQQITKDQIEQKKG